MRLGQAGDKSTFGIYSGHPYRGPQHMSRTLMAAENRDTPKLSDDRRKALNLAITQIEKTCGKGSIMRMGADSPQVRVEVIPTGAINLDAAIGIGGIPRGRVTEIFGPESSGKTTLALHIVGNAQRQGGAAAYIDAEHALDIEYAKKLGVDVDNLLISQPDTGEQGLEICEILVRSGALDVERSRAHQDLADLEALLARVGLGNQQVVHVHAELLRVLDVEGVLGVDVGRGAALALGVAYDVQGQRRLAARFRAEDLGHPPARDAADTDRGIE